MEQNSKTIEQKLIEYFKPGTFVTVPDAKGGANARIYRIIKTWESNGRTKTITLGCGRNKIVKKVKNLSAEAQVEVVFDPNFSGKSNIGKTTYALSRLKLVDIVELGFLHQRLTEIINIFLNNNSENQDENFTGI